MIDIRILRDNPDYIKKNYLKRRKPELLKKVDEAINKDRLWRKNLNQLQKLNHERNVASKLVAKLKGKEREEKVKKIRELKEKIEQKEKKVEKLKNQVTQILMRLPNLIHSSVPYGKDDSENVVIKKWGKKKQNYNPISHADIIENYGLAKIKKAGEISGARFYYLINELARLDLALQSYTIDFLSSKGFKPVIPPFMIRRKPYEGVTDLSEFEEQIYKIEGEDLYLIATSEHPIAAMHMNETLKELPLKYAGISPCFRKEAGSHGKDTKGIFRVHQFNKIEQFVFCKPEDSWRIHEELLKNEEEIIQSLGIPYRIVNVCTGDLGIVAAKKYDIEGWFPVQKKYRELTSCSNCTAYQARRLNIKYINDKGEKEYVHTLNATGIATTRIIASIIENFQEGNKIIIPKVLWPYTGGIKSINLK